MTSRARQGGRRDEGAQRTRPVGRTLSGSVQVLAGNIAIVFDTINGLPVHPLVVHAVVVLVPLAVLGTIVIAVVPKWRAPYGPFVVAAAAIGAALCPVATSSGESLEEHVGDPGSHAELGDQLVWFVLPVLILSAVLVWLARRPEDRRPGPAWLPTAVAVVAVLASVACAVQVYRVGDSGARAAWGDKVSSSSSGGDTDSD